MTNLNEYFDRQTPLTFRPKVVKPYGDLRSITFGNITIRAGLKPSGSGKVELFETDEDGEMVKVNGLYLQGTDWYELRKEMQSLKSIVLREGLPMVGE